MKNVRVCVVFLGNLERKEEVERCSELKVDAQENKGKYVCIFRIQEWKTWYNLPMN